MNGFLGYCLKYMVYDTLTIANICVVTPEIIFKPWFMGTRTWPCKHPTCKKTPLFVVKGPVIAVCFDYDQFYAIAARSIVLSCASTFKCCKKTLLSFYSIDILSTVKKVWHFRPMKVFITIFLNRLLIKFSKIYLNKPSSAKNV